VWWWESGGLTNLGLIDPKEVGAGHECDSVYVWMSGRSLVYGASVKDGDRRGRGAQLIGRWVAIPNGFVIFWLNWLCLRYNWLLVGVGVAPKLVTGGREHGSSSPSGRTRLGILREFLGTASRFFYYLKLGTRLALTLLPEDSATLLVEVQRSMRMLILPRWYVVQTFSGSVDLPPLCN